MKRVKNSKHKKHKIVFTSHSSENSHLSMKICKYVFSKGNIPINLFNLYGYFLHEMVRETKIFHANKEIIKRCDEVWVFGPISKGVSLEINLAKTLGIPVKFFGIIGFPHKIKRIREKDIIFESPAIEKLIQ